MISKRLGEFVTGEYETAKPKIEPEPLNQAIAQDLQVFRAATDELAKRKKENAAKEREEWEELHDVVEPLVAHDDRIQDLVAVVFEMILL